MFDECLIKLVFVQGIVGGKSQARKKGSNLKGSWNEPSSEISTNFEGS